MRHSILTFKITDSFAESANAKDASTSLLPRTPILPPARNLLTVFGSRRHMSVTTHPQNITTLSLILTMLTMPAQPHKVLV